MRFGYDEICLQHDPGPRHPEIPDRIRAVRRTLEATHGARFVTSDPADGETIAAVHDPAYVATIEETCLAGGGPLDHDTVVSAESWMAARTSVGLAIDAVATAGPTVERTAIPFALGRPPGHHAMPDSAMGFCIFNNVAIAAEVAIDADGVECVAIIDWDVHHGNGTEAIFLDRSDVLFASIHEDGLYPGTGAAEESGSGTGRGKTLNVPLKPGATTAAYDLTFTTVIEPWLAAHQPDLLIVSAGFDAHKYDPISRMSVTTEGFGLMTSRLLSLIDDLDAGIAFVLEGGYGLETLSDGVRMVHEVCHGYTPDPSGEEPRPADEAVLDEVRTVHGLGS